MTDKADLDEIMRLVQIGELELRRIYCSYEHDIYVKDKTGKTVKAKERFYQNYTVCGDCVRKEYAEEKEEVPTTTTLDSFIVLATIKSLNVANIYTL